MNTDTALPAVSDADIYDRIVSAILDHHLPPGTKLVEDKLATAFGVSRTRIRPVRSDRPAASACSSRARRPSRSASRSRL